MAMTKKEKAMLEAALMAAALRTTAHVEPDVPVPGYGEQMTTGYTPCYDRVCVACSTSMGRGIGRTDKPDSFGSGLALYSTRLLALRALRHEVERDCAVRLRRVDRMIEEEEGR